MSFRWAWSTSLGVIAVALALAAPAGAEPPVEDDSDNVFFLGTALAAGDGGLVVELVDPRTGPRESAGQHLEVLPGRGIKGRIVPVIIDGATSLMAGDGLIAELEPGAPVMVGGQMINGVLLGHFVVDLRYAQRAMPLTEDEGRVGGSVKRVQPDATGLSFPPEMMGMPGGPELPRAGAMGEGGPADADPIEFPGRFGGPAWTGDSGNLDIPLLIVPWIELDRIIFTVGLGGSEYDFPFSFEAAGAGPLFVDQPGDLEVMIEPHPRDPFTYYWAFGFNVAFRIKVCFLFWCKSYTYDFNLFSTVVESQDPAPMPGEVLETEATACPSIDLSYGLFDLLGVEFCQEHRFEGAHFWTDVAIENSQAGSLYINRAFDGTDPFECEVIPSTNPITVGMDDFEYSPYLMLGMYVRAYVFQWTIWQSPTIPMSETLINLIPTDHDTCETWGYGMGTCGDLQPTSVSAVVPVIPVVTSITTSPAITRYGDTVTVEVLVKGANGPATGPKEIALFDGEEFLATVPIDGLDVATFVTSTLDPCRHDLRAEYIGHGQDGATYPTSKTCVQIVTDDAETVRLDGYWQHQCGGNGQTELTPEQLNCCLAIGDYLSTVFCEVRDALDMEGAYDVLCLRKNHGVALDRLDRELLVAWLNFANGAIGYDQLMDIDADGTVDMPFVDLITGAEQVRLDPEATTSQIKLQTRILHTAMAAAP